MARVDAEHATDQAMGCLQSANSSIEDAAYRVSAEGEVSALVGVSAVVDYLANCGRATPADTDEVIAWQMLLKRGRG
jgi:hypothetical protein